MNCCYELNHTNNILWTDRKVLILVIGMSIRCLCSMNFPYHACSVLFTFGIVSSSCTDVALLITGSTLEFPLFVLQHPKMSLLQLTLHLLEL
jgi:hypothetical protein